MKFKKQYKEILTKEFLTKRYQIEKAGPHTIAKEVGCTPHTIYAYLKLHGIQQEFRNISMRAGETHNMLTTIEVVDKRKNGSNLWLCKCICGNFTKVETSQLKLGFIKSCGCQRFKNGDKHSCWKGLGDISGNYWQSIKHCAINRKIEFNITLEEAWTLFEKQNKICNLSGIQLSFDKNKRTASLDRIDSSKNYITSNIQWIHKDINKIKSDLSLDNFYNYCALIVEPLKNQEQSTTLGIYCSFWKNIQYNAQKRNKSFNISEADAVEIYNKQKGLCYLTGLSINLPSSCKEFRGKTFTASLDRIDNSRGYELDNLAWCHKTINQSRKDLDINYYKQLCKLIIEYRKEI